MTKPVIEMHYLTCTAEKCRRSSCIDRRAGQAAIKKLRKALEHQIAILLTADLDRDGRSKAIELIEEALK